MAKIYILKSKLKSVLPIVMNKYYLAGFLLQLSRLNVRVKNLTGGGKKNCKGKLQIDRTKKLVSNIFDTELLNI